MTLLEELLDVAELLGTTLDEDFGVEDDEEFAELEEVTTLEDDAGVALLLDLSLELEEDSSFLLLELDGFAELLDATTLDDEEATELLDATLDEDFAELLLEATELEDATTLELDCSTELLLVAELDEDFAELLDFAEFDEDEISSIEATTLILPVTVFVSP